MNELSDVSLQFRIGVVVYNDDLNLGEFIASAYDDVVEHTLKEIVVLKGAEDE